MVVGVLCGHVTALSVARDVDDAVPLLTLATKLLPDARMTTALRDNLAALLCLVLVEGSLLLRDRPSHLLQTECTKLEHSLF